MHSLTLLLDVVLALGAALLLGLMLLRLGQSPLVGYLLAGLLIGPGALGLLRAVDQVRVLAEIGVALLLFTIGLEFSWSQLRRLGRSAMLGGPLQILLTGAVAALLARLFGMGTVQAIALGMAVALSSTAVVFRVLADRAELDSAHGRVAVGVLLVQDVAVIPLVLAVPILTAEAGGVTGEVTGLLLRAGALIAAMIVLARTLLPQLLRTAAAARSRELFVILALTFCLGATWAATVSGLSPVLGAFLAGVLLADSPFAAQIRADVGPLRAGFVALFFVSIGMLADPGWIIAHALPVAGLVAAILVGKAVIAAGVVRALGYPSRTSMLGGLALAHTGELSFVVADLARGHGLLGVDAFRLIVSASVITLLLTPYVISISGTLVGALTPGAQAAGDAPADEGGLGGHVIVVGYGPTGARVVEALRRSDTPHRVIDLNPRSVADARRHGVDIVFGDATQEEILRHEAGIDRALAMVVTVPDTATGESIIASAKNLQPGLPVIARARYARHAARLARSGADAVMDEEEVMGARLAQTISSLVSGIERIQTVDREGRTPGVEEPGDPLT